MEKEFTDSLGNLVYDYDFHPPESTTKVHYVEQTCGETIFVPTGWHHQVWNLVSRKTICNGGQVL